MEWVRLELRRSSGVKREVDSVIRAFQSALENNDYDGVESLRRRVAKRIDELEEFYLDNDGDERAVLFEKQRLRLRQALQQATIAVKSTKDGLRRSGKVTTPDRSSDQFHSPSCPTYLLGDSSPKPLSTEELEETSPFSETRRQQTPRRVPKEPRQGHSSQNPSRAKKNKPPTPLYAWEVPEAQSSGIPPSERPPFESEFGLYFPSAEHMGFYQQHLSLDSLSQIDFQIVLTDVEAQRLSSKRRAHMAKKEKVGESRKESKFLFSSMPYIEPGRLAPLRS